MPKATRRMNFKLLELSDCEMLFQWLQQPRIAKWFAPIDGVNITYEEYSEIHHKRVEHSKQAISKGREWYYIVTDLDNVPFGCISCYNAKYEPCFFEKGIIHENDALDTFGIDDFFIGDESYLNHRLGKRMISEFIERILKPNNFVGRIVIDVNPTNTIAHSIYLALGFHKIAEFDDPSYDRMIVLELLVRT